MESEPKIFFINFDEDEKYFMSNTKDTSKIMMNELISKINSLNPDIIVSSVYNSLSCTSDHMLHHLMHLIDTKYKADREKNYEGYTSVTYQYKLLAKADTVRKKNSSIMSCAAKKILGKKTFGSRMRIFARVDINSNFEKNISENQKGIYPNNSYYNELFTSTKENYDCPSDTFCVTKIGYKRYTHLPEKNEWQKHLISDNRILFDITVKKNGNTFRYFFIYYRGDRKSENNKLFIKTNSNNSKNYNQDGDLVVPYNVKIFYFNGNAISSKIKYANFEANSKINFLNFKEQIDNHNTIKTTSSNSVRNKVRNRERFEYFDTIGMKLSNKNPSKTYVPLRN